MKEDALSGQHALITGGGSGIGLASAAALAAAGARVSICGRNRKRLQSAAKGNRIFPVAMDVCDEQSVRNAVSMAVAENGPVNIHVANAGIAESCGFDEMSLPFWHRIMMTNLDGAFVSIRESLLSMRTESWGWIITIASVAGLRGLKRASAYTASKHGLVGLARALSEELIGSGITANAICPGYVDTPILAKSVKEIAARSGKSEQDALAALLRLNRDRKLIDPHEVAATALWLCLSGSEGMNGQVFPISGGQV